MNSTPDPENFEALQKLLAMKRHEVPPPMYFSGFADKVLNRLSEPEPVLPKTWLQRFGLDFDFKPALVCASGVGLCALLIMGVMASVRISDVPINTASETFTTPVRVTEEAPGLGGVDNADLVAGFRKVSVMTYHASSITPEF